MAMSVRFAEEQRARAARAFLPRLSATSLDAVFGHEPLAPEELGTQRFEFLYGIAQQERDAFARARAILTFYAPTQQQSIVTGYVRNGHITKLPTSGEIATHVQIARPRDTVEGIVAGLVRDVCGLAQVTVARGWPVRAQLVTDVDDYLACHDEGLVVDALYGSIPPLAQQPYRILEITRS